MGWSIGAGLRGIRAAMLGSQINQKWCLRSVPLPVERRGLAELFLEPGLAEKEFRWASAAFIRSHAKYRDAPREP